MNILYSWVSEKELRYFIRNEKSLEFTPLYSVITSNNKIRFDKIILFYKSELVDKIKGLYEEADENETYQDISLVLEYFNNVEDKSIAKKNYLAYAHLNCYVSSLKDMINLIINKDIMDQCRYLINCKSINDLKKPSEQITNCTFLKDYQSVEIDYCEINLRLDIKDIINNIENKSAQKLFLDNENCFYLDDKDPNDIRDFTNNLVVQKFKNLFVYRCLNDNGIFVLPKKVKVFKQIKTLPENTTPGSKVQDDEVNESRDVEYEGTEDVESESFLRNISLSHNYYQSGFNTIPESFKHIITANDDFIKILNECAEASQTEEPILLLGETGTGKELFAQGIHEASSRKGKPFEPINCGAIPKDLLESELFGHVKGSFTGAIKDKEGIFEMAKAGTVFLDEIGELPIDMQTKLLRVLQTKEFRRIGGTQIIKLKARIISATNANIMGNFRPDLYYRINTYEFRIPPLRERGKIEIELLINYFIEIFNKNQKDYFITKINEEAKTLLLNYDWPGNVRQLESEIKRASYVAKRKGVDITKEIISSVINYGPLSKNEIGQNTSLTSEEVKTKEITYSDLYKVNFFKDFNLKTFKNNIETDYITEAINMSKSQIAASKILGISNSLLGSKIKKYNLQNKE